MCRLVNKDNNNIFAAHTDRYENGIIIIIHNTDTYTLNCLQLFSKHFGDQYIIIIVKRIYFLSKFYNPARILWIMIFKTISEKKHLYKHIFSPTENQMNKK